MPDPGATAAAVEALITGRRSIRAFRPDPVPATLVEHLLDVSARAPSGTNMQPWRVYALAGGDRARLSAALRQAHHREPASGRVSEYEYYPAPLFEPYLGRRRTVGFGLYGLLGIGRGEHARMHAQHARNLDFFDAPVGLIFTVHRDLKIGSWLDYGMFLGNIMTAARAHGLETCAQAAFAPFHAVIRQHLPIAQDEIVVCGMALGYEDVSAPENALRTSRVPARDFTTFLGFEDAEAGPAPG
ncbi:nitroreductase [Enterovirga sp.]|uniref:nitroreductase n=1 Tax=Enterovirga sp. TaxID=2026350 RepID=UPI002627A25E|nr:nitroreductase [Enterovirga sp.]MDB5590999.1 nitroreductase [Enterovirga sp.]